MALSFFRCRVSYVQYVHHSWQMKEQPLGISISFNLEKIDIKYSCCSIMFCEADTYPVDSLVSTIHVYIN